MTYTTNYHLPQWVKEDRIMMDDFNQMCLDLENGLIQNAQNAAEALAAVSANTAEDIKKAQATADAAQTVASAAYSPSNKPYVVGTYIGTGSSQAITLGFKPSFLIISCQESASDPGMSFGRVVLGGEDICRGPATFTSTGFTVNEHTSYPHSNTSGRIYSYIAFR